MNAKLAIALTTLLSVVPAAAQQADHAAGHAEHLGAAVMPFDLARSMHVFTPLSDGGTQAVTSRDGDPAQVELIRAHLRKEADAFARGDYADPSSIHGSAMPGLAELRAGAGRIGVTFATIPAGAHLRFTASDPALVAALHRWFEAQVRDHGADAMMHGS
ncbi:aspartate carbamoyltransferase [Mesorhizobium sp. M7A.F.Ca.US.008.03.1.1]|uniref:aspartate carbamoyltransferase n=1 Tax=Mesorhizobium sp. M7A.F.Ca.US.008.03.1.1 TaxID=2496742 RepID=UPI000FCA407D|nr:aspartate carbamoyltransferase [Mesorhizobium sp. M7A.F.Ca.US.008.03.1.1]RUW60688.1 aspartate carbamoyltransferase [Mesorhizobium sp. M7A.F.Ca.US.008.03.1.1]